MSSSVVRANEGGPSSCATAGGCVACALTLVRTRLALTPAACDAAAAAGRRELRDTVPDEPGTFCTRAEPGISCMDGGGGGGFLLCD